MGQWEPARRLRHPYEHGDDGGGGAATRAPYSAPPPASSAVGGIRPRSRATVSENLNREPAGQNCTEIGVCYIGSSAHNYLTSYLPLVRS